MYANEPLLNREPFVVDSEAVSWKLHEDDLQTRYDDDYDGEEQILEDAWKDVELGNDRGTS